jgi:hypothetical protein
MTTRPIAAIGLASLLLLPGCWAWVDSHPKNVEGAFRAALQQVDRIQSTPAAERGKPRTLRVLAYEQDDDELVKLSVPLWLVRKVAQHAVDSEEASRDLEQIARHGVTIDQILSGGRGMMLQADEDDEKVLIWLE